MTPTHLAIIVCLGWFALGCCTLWTNKKARLIALIVLAVSAGISGFLSVADRLLHQ